MSVLPRGGTQFACASRDRQDKGRHDYAEYWLALGELDRLNRAVPAAR